MIWVVNKEAAFDRLILLFNVKEERERESRLVGNIGIAAKVLKESMPEQRVSDKSEVKLRISLRKFKSDEINILKSLKF